MRNMRRLFGVFVVAAGFMSAGSAFAVTGIAQATPYCSSAPSSGDCLWRNPGNYTSSPELTMQGGGNTNFSLNNPGSTSYYYGEYCNSSGGDCTDDPTYEFVMGATHYLVQNLASGSKCYAWDDGGIAQTVELFFPYP